jgi:hypothetical protein
VEPAILFGVRRKDGPFKNAKSDPGDGLMDDEKPDIRQIVISSCGVYDSSDSFDSSLNPSFSKQLKKHRFCAAQGPLLVIMDH